MILLRALLLVGLILPCLTAPNLARSMARINEARARSAVSQARIRTNTQRLINQSRSRVKKQTNPDEFDDVMSFQPVSSEEDDSFERSSNHHQEPQLLHVCPIEENEDLALLRQNEAQNVNDNCQGDCLLKKALKEIIRANKELKPLDDDLNEDEMLQRTSSNSEEENDGNVEVMKCGANQPDGECPLKKALEELVRANEALAELQETHHPEENQERRDAEAEAHHHHHLHHLHSLTPHFGSHQPQTQVLVPGAGYTQPQTHFVTPGLNVNVNQAVNSGLQPQPFISTGFQPQTFNPGFNQHFSEGATPFHSQPIIPVHGTSITQTQSVGHQKSAEETLNEEIDQVAKLLKDAEADAHHHHILPNLHGSNQGVHQGHNILNPGSNHGHGINRRPLIHSGFGHQGSGINSGFQGQQGFNQGSHHTNHGHHAQGFQPGFQNQGFQPAFQTQGFRESHHDSEDPEETPNRAAFDPFNQQDKVMDFLDRHQFRQTVPVHYESEAEKKMKQNQGFQVYSVEPQANEEHDSRSADPHKLKNKKMQKQYAQHYPMTMPQHYNNNYRSGNEEDLRNEEIEREGTNEETRQTVNPEDVREVYYEAMREANPTHKLKKKKQQYQQSYQYRPVPTQQNYGYPREAYEDIPKAEDLRSAEEDLREELISEEAREANPTHKHKKKQQQNQGYGYHREANEDIAEAEDLRAAEEVLREELILDEAREANPTHKHKKKQQHNNGYGYQRETNEEIFVEQPNENEEAREANPTHKLKNKKQNKQNYQFIPLYQEQYNPYGGYERANEENSEREEIAPQNFGNQREANEDVPETEAAEDFREEFNPEAREANPTHKLKNKKQYQQNYQFIPLPQNQYNPYGSYQRTNEEIPQNEELEPRTPEVRSPYLFDIPPNHFTHSDQYKRSLDQILKQEHELLKNLEKKGQNDEDLKLIGSIGSRILADLEESLKKNKTKRSIPLARLIADPSVKLDVPRTMENIGTATKNAFEDERAPMYHVKHLVGSSRNALLSAMRIPPQNMVIPSDYQIVKNREEHRRRSEDQETPEERHFSKTYKRVGEMLRESIKSGQDTAAHINEIANDARNIIHTARHSAPRLLRPYSHVTALQSPQKTVLITPRIFDITRQHPDRLTSKPPSRPNFVKLAHLMDSVGISNPHAPRRLPLDKITFQPRSSERLDQLYNRFRQNNRDDNIETTVDALENAKVSVGAQNLRDFLVKMKNELISPSATFPHPTLKKHKKKQENHEVGKFIETLFDGANEGAKPAALGGAYPYHSGHRQAIGSRSGAETVGAGLYLPPELMHPFMNRASQSDLNTFLRDNGDAEIGGNDKVGARSPLVTLDDETLGDFVEYLKAKKEGPPEKNHYEELKHEEPKGGHRSDLGYVLGAINPMMFERMYNQTVKVNNSNNTNPHSLFNQYQSHRIEDGAEEKKNIGSMNLHKVMERPFMGKAQPQDVEDLMDTYNNRGQNEEFIYE